MTSSSHFRRARESLSGLTAWSALAALTWSFFVDDPSLLIHVRDLFLPSYSRPRRPFGDGVEL
jgi:hypothetical protein